MALPLLLTVLAVTVAVAFAAPYTPRWQAPYLGPGDSWCEQDLIGDVVYRDPNTFDVAGPVDDPTLDVVEVCADVGTDIELSLTTAETWDGSTPMQPSFGINTADDAGNRIAGMIVMIDASSRTAEIWSTQGTHCTPPVSVDEATWTVSGIGWECFDDPSWIQPYALVQGPDQAEDEAPTLDRPLQPAHVSCPADQREIAVDGRDDWLGALNYYRAQSGLPSVQVWEPWSGDQILHAQYLANHPDVASTFAHTEEEEHDDYTIEGHAAAVSSNLTTASGDAVDAIESWVQAPFHLMGNNSPALFASAYAEWGETALLDVQRGVGWVPDCVEYPVVWPGDGARVGVREHWGEWPPPLTSCDGYEAPSGPGIVVMPDPAAHPAPVEVGATRLRAGGRELEHCLITSTNYRNPDGFQQQYARSNLGNRVILMPREPFEPGQRYDVSVTIDGETTSWSFDVTPFGSRIAGAGRYDTAAAIARSVFDTADVVYVATGVTFPDALAGAAAAAKEKAPILLTAPTSLPDATRDALVALEPSEVVVLGGTKAVSAAVASEIGSVTGATVVRRSGPGRFETGVEISKAAFPDGADVVYVATGADFPDALAGTAAAGAVGAPMVLTEGSRLLDVVRDELVRLGPSKVVVIGGDRAVSAAVADAIADATGASVSRISGASRFDTAAAIAEATFDWPARGAYVATGRNFPDALAGAAVAGAQGMPVVLVEADYAPRPALDAISHLGPERIVVLGGTAAVSEGTLTALLER